MVGEVSKQIFILAHQQARRNAIAAIESAPEGYRVEVRQSTRSLDQNAKFHAICADLARAGIEWAGKPRTTDEWKVLLVSGHAVATKDGAEIVPGLEGEFVNIRESTARMTKARSSSLIEYATAWCALKGVQTSETD